jgi:hypothetical protein
MSLEYLFLNCNESFLLCYAKRTWFVIVSELMGRVRNVVLINVYLDLENPGGSGFWVGGYMSQVRERGS